MDPGSQSKPQNHVPGASQGQGAKVADPPTRATLSTRISALEKARNDILSSDPDSAIAKNMQEEIAKLKYEKVSSKSLGQQLDGCKSAIERAQKRRLAAQQQLEEATKGIEKETMEIAGLDGELKKVEIAIATQQ